MKRVARRLVSKFFDAEAFELDTDLLAVWEWRIRSYQQGFYKKTETLVIQVEPARANTAKDATNSSVAANITSAIVTDIVSPLRRQHSLQRRNSNGSASPLRQRENKVEAPNPGIVVGSSDEANKNTKAIGSAGPGSPMGPGRGTDGKENIQRNSFVCGIIEFPSIYNKEFVF